MTHAESKAKKDAAKAARIEEKQSKKAFNYLVNMAKRKGALVSVEYSKS